MSAFESPTGWTDDWRLFDTPETRRVDLQVKVTSLLELVLWVALCCQVATVTIVVWHWWSFLLLPLEWTLIVNSGPPVRHPLTSLVRIGLGVFLHSPAIMITGGLLMLVEVADNFLMPRLLTAGRGGRLPSGRETRRLRTDGLKRVREQRARAFQKRFAGTVE